MRKLLKTNHMHTDRDSLSNYCSWPRNSESSMSVIGVFCSVHYNKPPLTSDRVTCCSVGWTREIFTMFLVEIAITLLYCLWPSFEQLEACVCIVWRFICTQHMWIGAFHCQRRQGIVNLPWPKFWLLRMNLKTQGAKGYTFILRSSFRIWRFLL